jgi:hypothetical protein
MNSIDDGIAIETADRAIRIRHARAGARPQRLERLLSVHALALNRGRMAEALALTEAVRELQPDSGFYLRLRILDALYAGGDSSAARAAAARLPAIAEADEDARALNRCVVAQWRGTSFSHDVARPSPQLTICAAAHAALRAEPGTPDWQRTMARLDELYRSGLLGLHIGDGHVEMAPMVLARRLEEAGDHADALAAVRRRPYFIGWQPYLAASLATEVRLAKRIGDRAGAARAERHLQALRSMQ